MCSSDVKQQSEYADAPRAMTIILSQLNKVEYAYYTYDISILNLNQVVNQVLSAPMASNQ